MLRNIYSIYSMVLRFWFLALPVMPFHMAYPVLAEEQLCFDFSKAITDPLRPPLQGNAQTRDLSASGNTSSGAAWGAVRAQVHLSAKEVYDLLLDHYLVKDPKKVKLRIYEQEWKGFSDFHVVMVQVLNPLISIAWEENWAYLIAQGTREDPERVVISYQKAAKPKPRTG